MRAGYGRAGDCWFCSNTIIIAVGVSGVGKTTIGRMLAVQLRFEFADGDDFHPPPNVHEMSRNIPLTETDRRPWLSRIARKIKQWRAERRDFALACSALKHGYRTALIRKVPDIRLAYLHADRAILRRRLAARRFHYMQPDLLDSQLVALEPPGAAEQAIWVDVALPPKRVIAAIRARRNIPNASIPNASANGGRLSAGCAVSKGEL